MKAEGKQTSRKGGVGNQSKPTQTAAAAMEGVQGKAKAAAPRKSAAKIPDTKGNGAAPAARTTRSATSKSTAKAGGAATTAAKPAPAKTATKAAKSNGANGKTKSATGIKGRKVVEISPEKRHEMIAVAAFVRAERRGFAGDHHVEDWLAAEAEVDAMLAGGER
jgi:hypothetical protein